VEVWHTKRLDKEYENMPPIIKYITDQILTRSVRMNNLIVKLINQEKKEAKGSKEPTPWCPKGGSIEKRWIWPATIVPLERRGSFS
jgi:hypothetical protein